MRKTFGIIAASALAIAAFSAPAAAAPDAACFGQVHKSVNTGALGTALAVDNVGQFVQKFDNKGQGKNTTARAVALTFCD